MLIDHAAGWEPYNLYDLLIARLSWVGSVCRHTLSQTAGEDLDGVQ